MAGTPDPGNPRLLKRIADEIRGGGPIPFARFMELALHDPRDGYYARGGGRLGPRGDFFTASDVGTAFGECIARQIVEMGTVVGEVPRFSILEFGGGRGLLARDVLDELRRTDRDLAARTEYRIVDSSPGMRREAARVVPEAEIVPPEGLAEVPRVGCVLGVEVFDALPVHRLRRREGRLVEVCVDLDPEGRLVEREGEVDGEAVALAERYGAAPEEGDEGEVCPEATRLLARMVGSIERGFVLVVDYGHRAWQLYGPRHNRGTLLAYHRHSTNEDYLLRVGRQDLTAHVNFSQLEDVAADLGATAIGLTSQDRFLIANGILERFRDDDPDRWSEPGRVRRRLQAMQLIHPEGMGRAFRVLVIARGIDPRPRLAGLADPFAPGAEPPR